MKLLTGLFILLLSSCTLVQKPWVPLPCACENEIHGDSGYVSVKTGSRLLISQGFSDSLQDRWDKMAPDVNIGKYYLDRQTGHYIACVLDYHGHPVLLELKANEGGNEVVRAEIFPQGNYACGHCWGDINNSFGRVGNFFYLKSCDSSTQYCAGYLYVFKQIPQAGEEPHVWASFYNTMGSATTTLTSTYEMQDSTLIMHYNYNKLFYRYTRLFNIRIKKQKKVAADVRFNLIDGEWVSADSSNVKFLQEIE